MPDLDQLRRLTREAREKRERAARDYAAASQDLRTLQRIAKPGDERLTRAEARVNELRRTIKTSAAELDRLAELLEPVSDPRTAIGRLDAGYPILLFPLRLETRFAGNELLVRVYPDDCAVDSFEPDLSEDEVTNLRRYWCGMWSAGGDEGLERAAWRGLCAAHGAGRALYLLGQYQPLAGSDPVPLRASAEEVILAIPMDPPSGSATERNAMRTYWEAAWRAGRSEPALAAAFTALRGAVGPARAEEIRTTLAPSNFGDRPGPGVDRATVPLRVVVVLLPPAAGAATKRQSWTRAPEAALLPDRLLLLADSGLEHVEQLGGVIRQPLAVGPDPLAPQGEQFAGGPAGDLVVPEPIRWMTDFAEAVKAGMGFRVPLTTRQASLGFDRLYVIGLRLTADPDEAREELESLIQRQARSQTGFALLRQGTPTNNTEQGSSGWSRVQEADELFDVMRASLAGARQFDPTATDPYERRDGLALAEALGIDPAVLQDIPNAGGTDQAEARAMNAALWPATLGYWMDTQLRPVFTPEAIERTRLHFTNRVTGRGSVPAVRIGRQPYGILPTSAFGRLSWLDEKDGIGVADGFENPHRRFLRVLRDLLFRLGRDWWDGFAAAVPRVGRPAANPGQQLLDILGLHPSSVEFHLDVVDSAERIWNGYKFISKSRARLRAEMQAEMAAGAALLRGLGHEGPEPEILEKFFAYAHGPMNRPVIDLPPLSESDELTTCTDDGRNYVAWCRDAARDAFEDLRLQRGFTEGKTPNALFYHLLRHALQLGYHTAAVRLHELAGLVTEADLATLYREPTFIHVTMPEPGARTESRYGLLYARPEAITGVAGKSVADFIPEWIATAGGSSVLADQLAALDLLEHASTAALERAFAEHIDLCSYRWDAWMLSLVNERLAAMRGSRPRGLHVGAFGWLEGLAPEGVNRPAVELGDELAKVFAPAGTPPPVRDQTNGGHLLAPSQNHAVTAAVLRSGYLNNAAPAAPGLFAVDISSARVRGALQFIEGIRNGQPLGALLGYQFERRLHDRHAEAEMDAFIYQVRKAFPLAAKRITETVEDGAETAPIEQIEARNVCDGMLLLEHVRQSTVKTYPWGKALDPAGPAEQAILDQEVQALFEIQDAIADVAVAESVHQVTMGNPERAAAAMDAYGKGGFPPEPDVVTTPRSGLSLTHRVALHLPIDAAAPPGATPRAAAEPAIDAWLASVLPPLTEIVVRVTARNAPPGSAPVDLDVDMASLGLRPVDLLHLLDPGNEQAMAELDDRIAHRVVTTQGFSPDATIDIRYTVALAGRITVFQVAPLVASLRTMVLEARPLKPSDAAGPEEADPAADATLAVPAAQVTAAQTAVQQLRTDAASLLAALGPLALPAAAFATVVAGIDASLATYVAIQQRAGLCGVALAGAGGVEASRSAWFRLVRAEADKMARRWGTKLAACDVLLAEANDPANSNLMRVQALVKAEREISTAYTTPIPAVPGPLLAVVNGKRTAFVAARTQVEAVRDSGATTMAALWSAWQATFPGRPAVDLTVDSTAEEEKQLRLIAEDMERQVAGLVEELDTRLERAADLLTEASPLGGEAKAALLTDAAKALLGEGFRVLPRFTLAAPQGGAWQDAFDDRASLTTHLAAAHDFPVDDWLYGVARVRPRIHALETVIQLAGALGTAEPVLEPTQFPHAAGDAWMALELPAGFDPAAAGDRLLYTASYPGGAFDKTDPAFGGLLLDEWTEVIPATKETAGLTFHYDRPSHEPPQTMLLVTPASAGRQWTWEDLRAAIPDTFELAKRRAAEPRAVAETPLARLLPATLMAFTTHDISISSGIRLADVAFAQEITARG